LCLFIFEAFIWPWLSFSSLKLHLSFYIYVCTLFNMMDKGRKKAMQCCFRLSGFWRIWQWWCRRMNVAPKKNWYSSEEWRANNRHGWALSKCGLKRWGSNWWESCCQELGFVLQTSWTLQHHSITLLSTCKPCI
jgi:hypothetical protein